MTDRIRVLRVLEYEGPRDWVEDALASRAVKGERVREGAIGGQCIIRESIIGETPVVLGRDDEPLKSEIKPGSVKKTEPGSIAPKPEPCPGDMPGCSWPRCVVDIYERALGCRHDPSRHRVILGHRNPRFDVV